MLEGRNLKQEIRSFFSFFLAELYPHLPLYQNYFRFQRFYLIVSRSFSLESSDEFRIQELYLSAIKDPDFSGLHSYGDGHIIRPPSEL